MALTIPGHASLLAKGLAWIGRGADCLISNCECVFDFFNHAFADFRMVGTPILIANYISDGPQNFVALITDGAQSSSDEVDGESAGFERQGFGSFLPGTDSQLDQAGFHLFSNPNHPSLSFVDRTRFPRRSIHTEISPLRYASVEMTKGRVVVVRNN